MPMPDAGHVILVRQYRYAVERWLWELPAGSVEPGERRRKRPRAASATRRSARSPDTRRAPGAFYPDAGLLRRGDDLLPLSDLRVAGPTTGAQQDEDEDIEPRTFTLDEAREMVARGEIVDMKTVVGLTLLCN